MSTTFAEPAVQAPLATQPTGDPSRLEIVVTHEDIQAGVRRSAYSCAVACSLLRNGYWRVSVSDFAVRVFSDSVRGEYALTPELAEWIGRFDRGLSVEPERFVLQRSGRIIP